MSGARLGVLGGTFDPIHLGHLLIASELRYALRLDRVLFVPAGDPPHKPSAPLSPAQDRLAMLELALQGCETFAIDLTDLHRDGPSYTAEMLAVIAVNSPGARLSFLMGEDSLRDLHAWRDPEAIVTLAEIGVARRPGSSISLDDVYARVPSARGRVHLIDVPQSGFASRDIRQRVRDGRPIAFHVPRSVERYIGEHGLYQDRGN